MTRILFFLLMMPFISFAGDNEPTDLETEMLELINRLRANPQAEAQLMIKSGISPGHVDLKMFKKEMDEFKPAPPLVFNLKLLEAARKHTQYQLVNGQGHVQDSKKKGFTGASFMDRYRAAGYNGRGGGENVFMYAKSPWHGQVAFTIDWKMDPSDGGMQAARGHRKNLLSQSYTEIGVGMASPSNAAVTQNFGRGGRFIGGVAYKDKNKNGIYDAGEGIEGVEIKFGSKTVKTWKSGAYTLPVGNKSGKIEARWGTKHMAALVPQNGANFKFDFVEEKAQGKRMTLVSIFEIDSQAQKEGFQKFFSSRMDLINEDPVEMRDFIQFARKTATSAGQDKETARSFYNKILNDVAGDIEYYQKLIILKPCEAYGALNAIVEAFPRERKVTAAVTAITRKYSTRELSTLLKINKAADEVLNDPEVKEISKKSLSARVINSYKSFIDQVSSIELRKEAQNKLTSFEKTVAN